MHDCYNPNISWMHFYNYFSCAFTLHKFTLSFKQLHMIDENEVDGWSSYLLMDGEWLLMDDLFVHWFDNKWMTMNFSMNNELFTTLIYYVIYFRFCTNSVEPYMFYVLMDVVHDIKHLQCNFKKFNMMYFKLYVDLITH